MSTGTAAPTSSPPAADPFALGWRYQKRQRPDGSTYYEQVPLTPRDLLYPEEDDFVVTNDSHAVNCLYLKSALDRALVDRPGIKVFFDHRIDFQVPGLHPLGPDITVVDGMTRDWDPAKGTFRVKDYGTTPVLAIEVTSPSTRDGDLDQKVMFYQRARIPVYVLADLRYRDDEAFMAVMGYRLESGRYVRAEPDADGVLWVPELGVGFKPDGTRIVLLDKDSHQIPDHLELFEQAAELIVKLDDAEQRAEQEKQRAEQEKQRANELAARLDLMSAELQRLRNETP